MEISGKVLREVEFRDRLRGYDTDEVDEFLEKVAVSIDELRAEVGLAAERVREAERRIEDIPVPDDESIRRTLVLAQRTADLAIKEAREEAARLMDEATTQSQATVAQAQESARRIRDEAEQDLHDRVTRLSEHRERLEHEVQALAMLLEGERDRLTTALTSALRYVNETLSLSDEMTGIAASRSGPPPKQPGMDPEPLDDRGTDLGLGDIEDQISEDAAIALADEPPVSSEQVDLGTPQTRSNENSLDPDEELWARWAKGAGIDDEPEPTSSEAADTFGFDRPTGNWSA